MYIRLPALTTLLLLNLLSLLASVNADENDCLSQNDQLIRDNPPKDLLEQHQQSWLSLSKKCTAFPHIFHNLGVVNAKLGHWDIAASNFKESLEKDPRTQQSYQHLGSIYRHQAVTAYREALQSNSPSPKKPSFNYQLSEQQSSLSNQPPPKRHTTLQALVENWLVENQSNENTTAPEYWLNSNSANPYAVVHTSQRSYVLEFLQTQTQWQIFQERVIP